MAGAIGSKDGWYVEINASGVKMSKVLQAKLKILEVFQEQFKYSTKQLGRAEILPLLDQDHLAFLTLSYYRKTIKTVISHICRCDERF